MIILIYFLELKWKENFVLGKLVVGFLIFGNNFVDWVLSYVIDGFVLNRCLKIFYLNFEFFFWIKVDLMNLLIILFIWVFNRVDVLGIYNIYYMYFFSLCIDIFELF